MLILTRTACLGGDVIFQKFGNKHDFMSHGKVRIDLLNDLIDNKITKPDKQILSNWILQPEIYGGLYNQQSELSWLVINQTPDCIVMDSFSELTDKRFHYEQGNWDFCGLYGELTKECQSKITKLGLLDNLESHYDRFFSWVRNKYPDVTIIFLHFPITFEKREKYQLQGQAIRAVLDKLAGKYNIQNIQADPESIENVDHSDNPEKFAYHFTEKTSNNMAQKILFDCARSLY